jgi:hypothetical protein
MSKITQWDVAFPKPQADQVLLPPDITQIGSEDLGELFTRLTSWTNYVNAQLAHAQIAERRALKQKEMLENTMLLKRMGSQVKGERVTLIKAEIACNQDVMDLDNEYQEKYDYRKLIEMMLTNYERDLSLVSREITRRSNERFRRDL